MTKAINLKWRSKIIFYMGPRLTQRLLRLTQSDNRRNNHAEKDIQSKEKEKE